MRVYRYVRSDVFLVKNLVTFPVEGNCLGANRLATEPDVEGCYTAVHMCLFCVRVDIYVFRIFLCWPLLQGHLCYLFLGA